MPALARWDGAETWRCAGGSWGSAPGMLVKGGEDRAEGGHDRSLPSRVDELSGGEGKYHRRIVEGRNSGLPRQRLT